MTADYLRTTVDYYVRATAPGVLVDDISNTLHTCDAAGLFDEYTVEFWPNSIRLTNDTEETAIRTHYRQFQTWADSKNVSLKPAFTRRERTTLVGDDPETVLVLPVACLALRIDGELISFAPHTTRTTSYTVTDALADIRSLPRVKHINEIPPDHPARSMLSSDSAEDQSSCRTANKTATKQ